MKHTTKLLSIIAVTCMLLGLMGCQPTTGNIGCSHENTKITKNATCTETGLKECLDCGFVKETPALGHNFEETSSVKSTCTEDGHIDYKCSRCNDTKTDILPHGHKFNNTDTCTSCYSYKFKFIVVKDENLSNPKEYTVILDKGYTVSGENLVETFKKIPEFENTTKTICLVDKGNVIPFEQYSYLTAKITSPVYVILE